MMELFTTVFIFLLFFLVSRFLKQKKKLPPGPYIWPIIGNIVEMRRINPTYPHLSLAAMAKKYGDIMSIGFGVHYAVVLSSYESMKEILKKDEASISRYDFPYVADRAFGQNLGLGFSYGSTWREMKRFTVKTLKEMGLGRSQSMDLIMAEESDAIVRWMKEKIDTNDGILEFSSDTFAPSTVNTIWSFVGGYRFDLRDKKLELNLRNNDSVFEILGHNNVYTLFPFLKTLFPVWSQAVRHMEINRQCQDFTRNIIDEIKIKRSKRDDTEAQNFVESFMDEIEKNAGDPNTNFTKNQLIVVLMDLFLGGSDTTSTAMSWAILYLVLNPRVQKKLQVEIAKAIEPNSQFSVQDIKRIPYLKATISEILRISNFGPIPPPRKASADIIYKDYTIPKGAVIFSNLENILRDKDYWIDPEVFRPERFLNDAGNEVINMERIVVFGFGKRSCPGETLAWDTLSSFIVTLFKNFSFEAIPGNLPSPQEPRSTLTLSPKPFKVTVKVRK